MTGCRETDERESRASVVIEVDNEFERAEFVQIELAFAKSKEIDIVPWNTALGLSPALTPLLPMAALAVAAINLAVTVVRHANDRSKEKKLDYDRLHKILSTELAKQGVVRFEILELGGFRDLAEGTSKECTVTVRTRNDEILCAKLRRVGRNFSLKKHL